LIQKLEDCTKNLTIFSKGLYPVKIGKYPIWGTLPQPRRQRTKRRVVFFLTGYFRYLNWPRPNWEIIWDFLNEAGVVNGQPNPKGLGSWWSNLLKRELKPDEPIKPGQDAFIILFNEYKEKVWEK
jgi:hypothetical protein